MDETDRVNILLVDDQPSRLLTYSAILGDLGHNLIEARSGTEALARLMEDECAVILLDVSMPGMDGFETASLIHRHPRFERTPIVFVTGVHVTDPDQLKGYELGAVDYVYIPVVPEILRGKVAVLVDLYCRKRDLQRLNASLERANEELSVANGLLRDEKARELAKVNATLARTNAKLREANAELQIEVRQRAKVEQALREADRSKDEFLAILAHELRNPLAPVRNAVEIMKLSSLSDPDLVWSRDVIQRQVEHLTRLVDDLLDVSRVTLSKIELKRQTLDLGSIVVQAIETSRPLLDKHAQRLDVHLPTRPLHVVGDPVRLTQVVANLLNNASKFSEDGDAVSITLESSQPEDAPGAEAVIRVVDKGVGISPALLPRVFVPFVQASRLAARDQGGLGIGLALVRSLVALHGGVVTAHSEGDGRGSEFVVRLPLVPTAPPRAEAPRAPAPKKREPTGLRVLLVDDNVDAAASLGMLLRLNGHDVHVEHDGASALAAVDSFVPDLAILDIGMPGMNGYELASHLRQRPELAELALVALSGYGHEQHVKDALAVGFDRQLIKPVDPAVLDALLEDVARTRRNSVAQ